MSGRAKAIAFALVLLVAAPAARAYQGAAEFAVSANEGGGAGLYFTGSARWKGYDCGVCHIDAAGAISAELTAQPAFAGAWTPGTRTTITLRLVGEHLGGGALANKNTFVAEVVDDAGLAVADGFSGFDAAAMAAFDDGRILGARELGGQGAWTFDFTAPPAGRGPLTLHVGLVDADGAGDALRARSDTLGDDVAMLALRLCEGGAPCADPPAPGEARSAVACAAAPGRAAGGAAWGGLLLAAAVLAAARRRAGAALALLVAAAAGATGCHDPAVALECRDRICGDASAGPPPDAPPAMGCQEDWSCSTWEAPLGSDQATRTCTDKNMRGTTECKPPTTAALPALDFPYYQCRVEPILDRACSMLGCHGAETGRMLRTYSRGRLRNSEIVNRVSSCLQTGTVDLATAATGTVMCEGWLPHTEREWKKNFDSARSFMLGVSSPDASDLLQQAVVGGKPHAGVHVWRTSDPDYVTIRDWLGGATMASCDPRPN